MNSLFIMSLTWYILSLLWNLKHFPCVYPVTFSLACTILSLWSPSSVLSSLKAGVESPTSLGVSCSISCSAGHTADAQSWAFLLQMMYLSFRAPVPAVKRPNTWATHVDSLNPALCLMHVQCCQLLGDRKAKLKRPRRFTFMLTVILCISRCPVNAIFRLIRIGSPARMNCAQSYKRAEERQKSH